MFHTVTAAAVCLLALAGGAAAENMNGRYVVATGGGKQKAPFNDDYASKGHEYFDVWAPEIATHYGEVFWTDQHDQPLPDHIVERFKGKVIAITGYEQDQVMVQPTGQPGVNPDQDVSVPINWAYNHHYMMWMTGQYSHLERVDVAPDDTMAHGARTKWVPVENDGAALRADPDIPTSQMYSEGNGGESRKSFHGYPNRYAQLIESPTTWHITPMQIDTRNRDCGATIHDIGNCTKFTPGPEPKQARYAFGIPEGGTNYSGILECPCNSRYGGDPSIYGADTKTKKTVQDFHVTGEETCGSEVITDAQDCFAAVWALGFTTDVRNVTTSNSSAAPGCTLVTGDSAGDVTAVFNSAAKPAGACAGRAAPRAGVTTSDVGVKLELFLDPAGGDAGNFVHSKSGYYCSANHENVMEKFVMTKTGTAEAERVLAACEAYCAKSGECNACSVDCSLGSTSRCQWVALPTCGNQYEWSGLIDGDVSLKDGGVVTITASGPADAWFGIGFDAQQMSDKPYTLIVNSSGVIEQKIGTCGSEADHCPGTRLQSTVKVVSNTVQGSTRTVVMTRSYAGATADHYTFDPVQTADINLITAVGSSQVFAYHRAHAPTQIAIVAAGKGAVSCVCMAQEQHFMCDNNGQSCGSFVKSCLPAPNADLLAQDNPTCNSAQYSGGLQCCHNGRIMLDADQEIRPELLRYHMKMRFWFQEYVPANDTTKSPPSHYNLPRIYQQTEANAGEYDVPPAYPVKGIPIPGYPNWPLDKPTPGTVCTGTCPSGPDCNCEHVIHYKWNVSNMRLIYAGGHCHAPSCISIELYRNDTGELLCSQVPAYGTGNIHEDKYDEAGYATIPPCLWGPESEGLSPSVFLPENTPLLSIKRNRNMVDGVPMGHFGEMASWQMRGVNFPTPAHE